MISTLNVKENALTTLEALALVQTEIETLTLAKAKVLLVIHGYGSHGKGGAIKKELQQTLLPTLKKQNKIKNFFANEKFCKVNAQYAQIVHDYPELILNPNLQNLNPGVTIIILN